MFAKDLKSALKKGADKIKEYGENRDERLDKAIRIQKKENELYAEKTKLNKMKEESRKKYTQSWFPK